MSSATVFSSACVSSAEILALATSDTCSLISLSGATAAIFANGKMDYQWRLGLSIFFRLIVAGVHSRLKIPLKDPISAMKGWQIKMNNCEL